LLRRVLKGADCLSVRQAFELGTTGGARILGFDNLGTLEKGNPADIVLYRHDTLDYTGVHDLIGGLILAGDCHRADTVLVRGNIVVDNGKLVNVNEDTIREHANIKAGTMLKNAGKRTGKNYFRYLP